MLWKDNRVYFLTSFTVSQLEICAKNYRRNTVD